MINTGYDKNGQHEWQLQVGKCKGDFKFEHSNIKGSFKSYEEDKDKQADGEAKDTWYQEVPVSCVCKTNKIDKLKYKENEQEEGNWCDDER